MLFCVNLVLFHGSLAEWNSRIDQLIETEAAIKLPEGGSHQCPCVAIYDHIEQMQPKPPADLAALHCLCASRKVTAHGT